MEIRPREYWLGNDLKWDHVVNGKGKYYVCPPIAAPNEKREIVIHYPGSDWADMDFTNEGNIDVADTVYNVRKGHTEYLYGSRGYSYGYGWIVGQDGIILEGRGLDYENAANAGDDAHNSKGWNRWSLSIQFLVDVDQEANPAQIKAGNELIADLCRRFPRIDSLVWHGMRQYTACCGSVINQIQRGVIHLPTDNPSPNPDPVPEEGDDLLRYILVPRPDPNTKQNWWPNNYDPAWIGVYDSGQRSRMSNGDMEYANANNVSQYGQTSKEQYNAMLTEFSIPYPHCP